MASEANHAAICDKIRSLNITIVIFIHYKPQIAVAILDLL